MRLNNRTAAALATIGALALGTGPLLAQEDGRVVSRHGAWNVICNTPPGATSEQCALVQNVVDESQDQIGLSVSVLKTADSKARILKVLTPLGVLLPNGLGLNIDGKSIGRANFVRCRDYGCWVEVILDEKLMTAMNTGTSATFIIFDTPEEGIGIPVDLDGFTEGFSKLP